MYEIRSISLKEFIKDKYLKLPRFQRKQTWDDKKNFQLCISLFKEYPIGVSIVSIEKKETDKWLLDGRQRRNALSLIFENPENIYFWGQKFIGFKKNDKIDKLEDKYWKKILEYIESDSDESMIEEDTLLDDSEFEEDIESNGIGNYSRKGLDLLLEIIKVIHMGDKNNTGFTKPFDLRKFIDKLPYVENKDGNVVLSPKRLKTFLGNYDEYCQQENLDYEKYNSFIKFLYYRGCIVKNEEEMEDYIKTNWGFMYNRILMIDKIDELLSNSKIGIIEVKNLSPADSQKVFNIINTECEKLTAVEVLSAKPNWNKIVDNPSEEAKKVVKELYERMGINSVDDVVRWDLAATLVRRLGKNIIIKNFDYDEINKNTKASKSKFETEITLGFKILSGIYQNGVKKENIEELSKNNDIDWECGIDKLIKEFKSMIKIIESSNYFRYLKSWNIPIFDFTSNFIVMNFIIILYKDWERKGKPSGNDIKVKQFQKNSFILMDRLIYEYIKGIWKGSSDTNIARNIKDLDNKNELFEHISLEEWKITLAELFESNSINGAKISSKNSKKIKALLLHFYCLNSISGPGEMYDIDIDHIIPVSLFDSSVINNSEIIRENILNLGLLPKQDNISKSNKRLSQIKQSEWLSEQVKKYEFIDINDFDKYSNINNYKEMFEFRRKIFEDTFFIKRENLLNN